MPPVRLFAAAAHSDCDPHLSHFSDPRRDFADFIQATVAATGKLNADGQRHLSKVVPTRR
jgi:hypothetical protein